MDCITITEIYWIRVLNYVIRWQEDVSVLSGHNHIMKEIINFQATEISIWSHLVYSNLVS